MNQIQVTEQIEYSEVLKQIKQGFEQNSQEANCFHIMLVDEIKTLRTQVEELKKMIPLQYIAVADEEAKTMIMAELRKMKASGATNVDIIDLIDRLKLHPEQIARIMRLLENEKILSETDG